MNIKVLERKKPVYILI